MEYTPKQMEYIDSVDGMAHMSAVKIIGEQEAENARLKALLEHSKTQLEYDELQAENEKARLFRLEVQEAVEALIGCEDDKALRILEQALGVEG